MEWERYEIEKYEIEPRKIWNRKIWDIRLEKDTNKTAAGDRRYTGGNSMKERVSDTTCRDKSNAEEENPFEVLIGTDCKIILP